MVRFRETLQSDYIPESCTAWLTCAIAFFLDTQYFHLGIKPHWKNKKLENKNTMPCSCKISQRMVFDKLFLAEEIDKIMDMKIKNWTRLIKNSKLCSYCRFNNTEVNVTVGLYFIFLTLNVSQIICMIGQVSTRVRIASRFQLKLKMTGHTILHLFLFVETETYMHRDM